MPPKNVPISRYIPKKDNESKRVAKYRSQDSLQDDECRQKTDDSGQTNYNEITKKCEIHSEENLDFYCSRHDTVACALCISTCHTHCSLVDVSTVSRGVNKGSAIEHLEKKIKLLYMLLEKSKHTRVMKLEQIKEEKQNIIDEIVQLKLDLIKKLDELEKDLLKKLATEYNACYVAIGEEKDVIKKNKGLIKTYQQQLAAEREHNSENNLFCFMKLLEAKLKERENEIQKMSQTTMSLSFTASEKIVNFEKDLTYFGNVESKQSESSETVVISSFADAQAVLPDQTDRQGNNILSLKASFESSNIENDLEISSACLFDSNGVLLCPFKKPIVYWCSYDGSEYTSLKLKHTAFFITQYDTDIAVLSLGESGKIQFIKLENGIISPNYRYDVGRYCAGITGRNGKIWVGTAKTITTLDIEENTQKTMPSEFTPWDICVNRKGEIYFAEFVGNSIRIVHDTKVLFKDDVFVEFDSLDERHIAIDEEDNLFVSENIGNKIYRITDNGRVICPILTTKDGINQPTGMSYCIKRRRLMVINNKGRSVLIFQMK